MKKTIAASMALAGINGNFIQEEALGVPTCVGTFQQAPTALFIDCYDENGVMENRQEYFLKGKVEQECTSRTFDQIKDSIAGWKVPEDITDDQQITECEFYEWGKGYVFTQFGAGIGPVVEDDKINGARSTYYQSLSALRDLNWDWNELSSLLLDNCPSGVGVALPSDSGSSLGVSLEDGLSTNQTELSYNWK